MKAESRRLFRSQGWTVVLLSVCVSASALASGERSWCTRSTQAFSGADLRSPIDDAKKLSLGEFGLLAVSTPGKPTLSRGVDLNVVVDLVCLADPARGPQELPWLMRLKQKLPAQEMIGMRSFSWLLESDREFQALQESFEREPCVHLVSPNRTYRLMAEFNDPLLPNQEHLRRIHHEEALATFLPVMLVRKKIVVAVIDSGVDFKHTDLDSAKWVNRKEVAGNGLDDDRNGYVDDVNGYNFASDIGDAGPQGFLLEANHGTHVAGLIAAKTDNGRGGIGVGGGARIMSLNIFGTNNTSRSVLLENAIRYAADMGADIINMSLGGSEYSRTMRSALDYAIARGAFVVTAAGNFNIEICESPSSIGYVSPAIFSHEIEGMMAVSSVDAFNGRLSTFSNYSNRLVEISAPGSYISETKQGLLSTFPGNTYSYLSGTSMAAPVVSGSAALALMWMRVYGYPASPARLESIMKNSAKTDASLAEWVQGGRTLDLETLAAHLKAHYPARTMRVDHASR